jgi:hypothetical protein
MAYCGNRDEAVESVIDADPIAAAVRSFMAMRTEWTGTASDLLGALAEHVGETQRKNKSWPDSARALAGRLRRAATFLRKVGIEVTFGREGRARTRTIRLTAGPENGGSRPSTRSALPVSNIAPLPSNGLPADAARTVASPADGCEADPLTSVRSEPLKTNGGTVADDGLDGKVSPISVLANRDRLIVMREIGMPFGSSWQDAVIAVVQWGFVVSLLPMVFRHVVYDGDAGVISGNAICTSITQRIFHSMNPSTKKCI